MRTAGAMKSYKFSNANKDKSLDFARKDAAKIAKELYYPSEVIDKINAAKSETEIVAILRNARKDMFK